MTGPVAALPAAFVAPSRPATRPPPPAAPALATASQAGLPNPTLHLDPALGLVVMQFRDGVQGAAMSIPTAQQLAAYQAGSAAPPRHDPAGAQTA